MSTFPFSTCEKPSPSGGLVQQPWSFSVNVICVAVLVALLPWARNTNIQVFLASLIAFQAWHAFSHARHVQGPIQAHVIHALTYVIAFASALAIYDITGIFLVSAQVAVVVAVLADVLALTLYGEWAAVTGTLIVAAVVLPHLFLLPNAMRVPIFTAFAVLIVAGIGFFAAERQLCEAWLKEGSSYPYHVHLELVVSAFVVLFAITILWWQSR